MTDDESKKSENRILIETVAPSNTKIEVFGSKKSENRMMVDYTSSY